MPRFYLGVDGGQSSTTALIADDTGHVVGRGRGGPCNHVSGPEGKAKFAAAIAGCVAEACMQADIDSNSVVFVSVCLGFSGGAEDKDRYSRELIRSEKYKITHDAEIALAGATAGEPGIVVIAGTGSVAFGRNAAGKTGRAGGWGYIFGDEGGAFDLTRRALRASLQFEEGWGPPTSLYRLLLGATAATSANALLHDFYAGVPRAKVAGFSKLVTLAAAEGDDVAHDILNDAATELARLAGGVFKPLFSLGQDVHVAYIGGVFQSEILRNEFVRRVLETLRCRAHPARFGPAAGALLEALRLDGNRSQLRQIPDEK